MVKNPPASVGDARDRGSIPGLEKISWNRKQLPTPVFLPEKSQGQRNLVGYSLWSHKESDRTAHILVPCMAVDNGMQCKELKNVLSFVARLNPPLR